MELLVLSNSKSIIKNPYFLLVSLSNNMFKFEDVSIKSYLELSYDIFLNFWNYLTNFRSSYCYIMSTRAGSSFKIV